MTPDETILEPLGGEDNLRMMCDADNFIYYGDGEVGFSIGNLRVSLFRSCSPIWVLSVWDAPRLHRSFSRGAIKRGELACVFSEATGYTLRF